jgi:hypothetical protein
MSNKIQYDFTFDDITIIETDGNYDETKKIMSEDTFSDGWMLESNLLMGIRIGTKYMEATMLLHFYGNGNVYIMEYQPSSGDVFYNPDVRGFVSWAKYNGWKSIRPFRDLVKGNVKFWKYFWETHMVDSDYLEQQFGKRESDTYQEEDV